MPTELQITLLMMCMEGAPQTRTPNNGDLTRSRVWREQKEVLAKGKGLEEAEDKFIASLIFHKLGNLSAFWKTVGEIKTGLNRVKTKGAMIKALKVNIHTRWKDFGWSEYDTR